MHHSIMASFSLFFDGNNTAEQFNSSRYVCGNEQNLQQFPFSHFKFVLDTRNSKLFGKYSEYGFSLRTSTSAHATTSCVTEICSVCNSKRLITSHILFCYLFNFSPLFFSQYFFLNTLRSLHTLCFICSTHVALL